MTLAGALLILRDHFNRGALVFSIPLTLLALFYITSAEVEAR